MEENKEELIPLSEAEEAAKETEQTPTDKPLVQENPEEDDFAEELLEMEHEEADNEIIEGLGESINKQVALEIDPLVPEGPSGDPDGPKGDDDKKEKEEKKGILGFLSKVPKWIYIVSGIVLFIILLILVLKFSGLGVKIVSWFIDSNIRHEEIDANVSPVPTLP